MALESSDYKRMIKIWERLGDEEKARFLREADDHSGIPRDANGVPSFFILPPGIQASYGRQRKQCKRGWEATRDPLAVAEALTWTRLYRQPAPEWVDEALWILATKRRGQEHAKRAREAAVRLMRYQAVREAHYRGGLGWNQSYEHAAEVLADMPWAAAEPDTMKKAYFKVLKDLRSGRGGLYFMPQIPSTMRQGRHKIAWGELDAKEAPDGTP